MSSWAVVRVATWDHQTAMQQIVHAFAPVTMSVDLNPPASGPEVEFSVRDHREQEVRNLLGPMVLASKTVLEPPYDWEQSVMGVTDKLVKEAEIDPDANIGDAPEGFTSLPKAIHDEMAPPDPKHSAYHNPPKDY